MSIAEKLTTIVENVPKVYQAGYDKGKSEGGSVQNLLEYASSVQGMFQSAVFPTDYELTINIPNASYVTNVFYLAKGIKKVILKGNVNSKALNFTSMFRACSDLQEVDFTEFNMTPENIYMIVSQSKKLVSLIGEFDMSKCTNTGYAFGSCPALEEIYFKPETINVSIDFAQSSRLSANSIQSIIDGLATVETTQTLTLHKNIVLTDEQKATIKSKNFTLVQ